MATLCEELGLPRADGSLGVEIECEGENLREFHNAEWTTHKDGSLRGEFPYRSAEYVMQRPLDYKEAVQAVRNLKRLLANNNAKLEFSFRTSVHVHCNVQELTMEQIGNFIYTYLLFENALVGLCGSHRIGNRFCLRLQDSDVLVDALEAFLKDGFRGVPRLQPDQLRYAALNVASLNKYGSIEIRSMQGTLDEEVLSTWFRLILSIRKFAKSVPDRKAIAKMLNDLGVVEFTKAVFKEDAPFLIQSCNIQNEVLSGYSYSLPILHA